MLRLVVSFPSTKIAYNFELYKFLQGRPSACGLNKNPNSGWCGNYVKRRCCIVFEILSKSIVKRCCDYFY